MQVVSVDSVVKVVAQQPSAAWLRSDIARALGRAKTTHVIQTIERAVREGRLQKLPGYDANFREAWVYTMPGAQLECSDM
jgi:hypothetical protein